MYCNSLDFCQSPCFIVCADAQARLQTTDSAQLPEVATAVSDRPILSQTSPPPPQSPAAAPATAHQPSRFASEAATEVVQAAETSNGGFAQAQDQSRQESGAPVARGLSDTPWLSEEAVQTTVAEPERLSVTRLPERDVATQQPQQEFVSQQSFASSTGTQEGGFAGRAGRLPEEPLGRAFGQQSQSSGGGFEEQPQQEFVSQQSFGSQEGGFAGRAGRLPEELQGRAFGQQPQVAQPYTGGSVSSGASQEPEQQGFGGARQVTPSSPLPSAHVPDQISPDLSMQQVCFS